MVYQIEYLNFCFIFGLFFILISILGYLFLNTFFKKINKLPFLNIIILSLGIGITIYCSYSYLIDTFLIFNFYTITLPIILIDVSGIIYLILIKSDLVQRISLKKFKKFILDNIRNFAFLLISLVIIYYFQFQFQYPKIAEFECQFANDPFYSFKNAMFLIDYGHLDHNAIHIYSAGSIFLNAGILLFYPDYRFGYFFIKYSPILYTSLLLFIVFVISSNLLRRKFMIFLSMFSFFILEYFNYRFSMSLPSVPATILFFIFSITFINDDIPYYLKGIFLAGIIIIHPVNGILSLLCFILYSIIKPISKNMKKKRFSIKNFKKNLYIFMILFLFLLPYFINLTLKYRINWYINYYKILFPANLNPFIPFFNPEIFHNLTKNLQVIYVNITFLNFDQIIINLNSLISDLNTEAIKHSWLIFFILFYFFIRIKKKNFKRGKDFIRFLKISIVFSLIYNYLFYFNLYSYDYNLRVWELFAGYLVLMFVFSINDIYLLLSKITKKAMDLLLSNKKLTLTKKYNKFLRFSIKNFKIESVFLIITLISVYGLYENNDFRTGGYKWRDDNIIEAMIELGRCEPPNSNITVMVQEYYKTAIYYMLYRFNYVLINYSSKNYSYEDLTTIINENNAKYIVLPVNEINQATITNFTSMHLIYYQNINFLIIKIY